MVQFVLVRKKKVVVFPKFSLVTLTASSFRGGFSLGMSPLHVKVWKSQCQLALVLGEQVFQRRLGLAAVGTLEIGKLHDHHPSLGIPPYSRRVISDLDPGRLEQD